MGSRHLRAMIFPESFHELGRLADSMIANPDADWQNCASFDQELDAMISRMEQDMQQVMASLIIGESNGRDDTVAHLADRQWSIHGFNLQTIVKWSDTTRQNATRQNATCCVLQHFTSKALSWLCRWSCYRGWASKQICFVTHEL